jgi:hypothetical protein
MKEKIYIERGNECPYYYEPDEDDRPCDAIEYVRADLVDELSTENERLREELEEAERKLVYLST